MSRRWSKFLTVLALMTAAVFLLNILIDNPYSHRIVAAVINEKVTDLTTVRIEFQAIEVRVFPPGFDLYGLKVIPRTRPDVVLLESAHLKVRLSVTSLLLGQPKIGVVELNELNASLPFPAGLEPILPPSKDAKDEPINWPPTGTPLVKRIELINSNLKVAVPAADPTKPATLDARITGINAEIAFGDWEDVSFDGDIQAINIYVDGAHLIQDSQLVIDAELKKRRITTNHFELVSALLNAKGTVTTDLITELPEKSALILRAAPRPVLTRIHSEASLNTMADFRILGAFLGVEQTDGLVRAGVETILDVPLNGDGSPRFEIKAKKAKLENARIDGFKLMESQGDLTIDSQALRIDHMAIYKGTTHYGDGSGIIHFNEALDMEFRAAPRALPLVTLLDAVQVADFTVIDSLITANDLLVKGQGFPFGLKITARADFDRITSPFLAMDTTKFPVPPACKFTVNIVVETKALRLDGSGANCDKATKLQAIAAPWDGAPGLTHLDLSGPITFDNATGMRLKIRLPRVEAQFAEYFAQIALAGTGQAETTIFGPYDKLKVEGNLLAQEVSIATLPFGTTSGSFVIDVPTSQAEFTKIQSVSSGGMRLTVPVVSLGLTDRYPMRARYRVERIPATFVTSAVALAAPTAALGFAVATLEGNADGPLMMPLAWTGNHDFSLTDGRLGSELLFSRVEGRLRASISGVEADDIRLLHGDYAGSVKARLKRVQPFSWDHAHAATDTLEQLGLRRSDKVSISLRTTPAPRAKRTEVAISEDHLGRLPNVGKLLTSAGVAGTIDVAVDLEGTLAKLEGQFDGAINDLRVMGSEIAAVHFKGFVDGGKIELPIINHSGRALVGRFTVNVLDEGLPYAWYFNLDQMDMRCIAGHFFQQDPRNYLYVKADWSMAGRLTDWWSSRGQLKVEEIRARFTRDVNGRPEKIELAQEAPVRLTMGAKGWEFDDGKALVVKSSEMMIKVETAGNRPPEELGVMISGSADMSILRNLVSAVESSRGRIELTGAITGAVERPDFTFSVRDRKMDPLNVGGWEPLSLGVADIPPAFTNIRVEANYRNGRLEVASLSANKGKEGRINVAGVVDPDSKDAQANRLTATFERLELKRLPIPLFETLDTTVSGDLTLTGTALPLKLSGNIVVDDAKSITNFDVRNKILQALSQRRIAKSRTPTDPILSLDVQLTAENTIFVKNRNMSATLSTDLRVMGTDTAPTALGTIGIPRGKFFYKRDFEIRRGLLIFDEPVSPPDPKLDIIGESVVSGYRVNVVVTGYSSDPKVALTADPSLRQDGSAISKFDILVLLSSGKLPEGDRTSAAAGAAAQSEALSIVAGQFEEPIEKLFELSGQNFIGDVYLDTYTQTADSTKGTRSSRPVARLNLPVKLTDDLGMMLQVDDDSNMKVSSDYSVHENITTSVVVEKKKEEDAVDNQGLPDTGVDLRFRFSFP